MTFPISAQRENIHIGACPLNKDPGRDGQEAFEVAEIGIAANRYLSITTGAVAVMPSVGYGFINEHTSVLAESDSTKTASPAGKDGHEAIIYASVNGSMWTDKTYDVDGEFSWAVLEQMKEGYPKYIPKVRNFTRRSDATASMTDNLRQSQEEGDLIPGRKHDTKNIIANIE